MQVDSTHRGVCPHKFRLAVPKFFSFVPYLMLEGKRISGDIRCRKNNLQCAEYQFKQSLNPPFSGAAKFSSKTSIPISLRVNTISFGFSKGNEYACLVRKLALGPSPLPPELTALFSNMCFRLFILKDGGTWMAQFIYQAKL